MSLGDDLRAAATQADALGTVNAQLSTDLQAKTLEVVLLRVKVSQLEQALADCLGEPEPPPTPTPVPPPGPQPPDIPAGTDVTPAELVAKLAAAPNGAVFRVKPGTVTGAYLKLKPGQQVWGLDPANMPWFKGANSSTVNTSFATGVSGGSDVTLAYLKVSGYHPADPSWKGVSGSTYIRQGAIDGNTLPKARLYRLEMLGNGMAIKLGEQMLVEKCYLHHNHHHGVKGNTEQGWKILGGEWAYNNVRSDGAGYYDHNWEAANKFVSDTNGLIEDLFTHHNYGPGVWFDSGGNAVVIRRVRAEDNKGPGFFWEINNGWCIIENCSALRNEGAANIYVSSSKGTASNPIIVRNNVTSGHYQGREIRMLGNGDRQPGLGYVSILNNVCANVKLALSNNHPQPVGIVVTGNKNAAGQAVNLTTGG